MQQQQLAQQLATHGSSRAPQLSPPPATSDSDSDISLGTHSPPVSSPNPLRYPSPTPINSFPFNLHSPGPMPQYPPFRETPPMGRDLDLSSNFRLDRNTANLRVAVSESPVNVDASEYRSSKDSPIRVDVDSPPQTTLQQHSPPMNLRMTSLDPLRMHPEAPVPLRLGTTAPLRIQVSLPSKMSSSQQTNLHLGESHGIGGIVRIAAPSPANPPPLHRPFSPPRLT